jgi:hypothetical protein
VARARTPAFLLAALGSAMAARVTVAGAGSAVVNGVFARRDAAAVPAAFARVCVDAGWDSAATWARLNGPRAWWEAENSSYFYFNRGDGKWWLDSGETGLGLYISQAAGAGDAPPRDGWRVVGDGHLPLPSITVAAAGRDL